MVLPETFVAGFHDETSVKKMPYRKLGKLDINISKVGFGGGSVSGFYGEFEQNGAIETIRAAVKSGINYIDTAPYYGQGRSEKIIGIALKEIPREAYYLSTKVGRYTSDYKSMFDYSASKITSGLENSMKLLGVNYVDILVVHDVEFADMKQILEETLPCIKNLVESGKVRYIGISGYPVQILWETVCNSPVPIDTILTYSRDTLIDRTLHDFISLFKNKGIGIINAAPTAMGMLTNAGPQSWHPADGRIKQLCSQAAQYCKDNDVELGRLAVYHTMKNDSCDNILVGNNTKELLQSNLDLAINGLSKKEQKVLDHLYEKYFLLKENSHWEGVEVEIYRMNVGI